MISSHASRLGLRSLLAVAVVAAGLLGAAVAEPQAAAKPAGAPKYIGSAKCKNCHNSPASGDQYGKWKEEKHAKAFESLALADAKKLGKEKGVDDPQKAAQCVKCHSTAAGEPEDRFVKGFDHNAGVQCESCHGPGEKHMKARMAAAATAGGDEGFGDDDKAAAVVEIPKDEIGRPTQATCVVCHNKDSPSYKPFCFKKRVAELGHLDPRKKRAPDYLASLQCDCDDCKKAKGGP